MTGPAPRVNVAELRARVALLPYLPAGNPVRRINENLYVALCVFHSEDRPSLRIARHRGVWRYHCFPCGAEGDVIDFLTKARGLSFRDAVRELGGEAVQLEAPSPLRSLDVLVCDACGASRAFARENLPALDDADPVRGYLSSTGRVLCPSCVEVRLSDPWRGGQRASFRRRTA